MGNTLCSVPIAVRLWTTKSGINVHWERPLERGQGRGRIQSYRIDVEVDSVTQTAYEQAFHASWSGRGQHRLSAREWGARAATAAALGNDALVASCIAGQVNAAAAAPGGGTRGSQLGGNGGERPIPRDAPRARSSRVLD